MAMSPSQILINCKFYFLIAQFVLTIMIFTAKHENILAGIPSNSQATSQKYRDADTSVKTCLAFNIIFLAAEFLLLIFSINMFDNQMNLILCFLHGFGVLFYGYFMIDSWDYITIWYLFIFFNALPVLVQFFYFIIPEALKKFYIKRKTD